MFFECRSFPNSRNIKVPIFEHCGFFDAILVDKVGRGPRPKHIINLWGFA